MTSPTTLSYPPSFATPVEEPRVVRWTRVSSVVAGGDRQATADDILAWLKNSPLRDDEKLNLRVQLRQSTKDANVRQLRRTLQSLGCTVTSLTSFVADR
jgi:hypothetical protein